MCDDRRPVGDHHFSPDIANQWYYSLQDAISSLQKFPNRCALAKLFVGIDPEASIFGREIRQFWVGKQRQYRIIFVVEQGAVAILHIRHSRQPPLKAKPELQQCNFPHLNRDLYSWFAVSDRITATAQLPQAIAISSRIINWGCVTCPPPDPRPAYGRTRSAKISGVLAHPYRRNPTPHLPG